MKHASHHDARPLRTKPGALGLGSSHRALALLAALACITLGVGCRTTPPKGRAPVARSAPRPALPALTLAEVQEQEFSLRRAFTNQTCILRIETYRDVDPASAQTLIEEGIMGVEALFANALSPYPENLSHQVVVDSQYRPLRFRAQIGGSTRHFYILYANDRFSYGATTQDTVHYKSLLGWIHCPDQQQLHRVKFFLPPRTPNDWLQSWFLSLKCHEPPLALPDRG